MAHRSIRNEEQFQELMYRWLNHFDWVELTIQYNLPSGFMWDVFNSFERLDKLKIRHDDPRFPPLAGLYEEIESIKSLLDWSVWWCDADEFIGPPPNHWPSQYYTSYLGHVYEIIGQIILTKTKTPADDEVIHTEFII